MCQPVRSGLNIAFNRNVRAEFTERMPEATNHTFNSFGHWIIKQNLGTPRFDAKKVWFVFEEVGFKGSLADTRRLVEIARNCGVGPSPTSRIKHTDMDWWERTIDEFDLDVDPRHVPLLPKVIERMWALACDRIIDYTDQIWCPVVMNLSLGRPFGVVYVDEAQDMNPMQEDLISRMARQNQIILVGDPHQAIYGFRGAVASMPIMERRLGIVEPLPLTVTYRCPKAVVREAQQWVPEYTFAPEAPEGSVATLQEWSHKDIPLGATILCRNNAPLVRVALYLLANQRGATIRGTEIGKGLVKVLKGIAKEGNPRTPEDLLSAIKSWYHSNYEKAGAEDKAECLTALVKGLKTASIDELIRRIQSLFSEEAGLVTLSTIHKAKGLEWTSVFFLDRYLIPSRLARGEEQLQQETNLLYVGVTRAKHSLTYIRTDGLRA
jgi:hypothetical protein